MAAVACATVFRGAPGAMQPYEIDRLWPAGTEVVAHGLRSENAAQHNGKRFMIIQRVHGRPDMMVPDRVPVLPIS